MKEFKYKSKPQEFKGVKETTYNEKYKSVRRVNVPRIIYFVVLIFIAVVLVYYFVERSIFVSGKGLVLSDNIQITIDEDVEIMHLNYKVGDKVKAGDTVVVYCSKTQAKSGKEILSRIYKKESSYQSDKYLYRRNIRLKEIKRDHYKRKINSAIESLARLKEEVKLNISKADEIKRVKEKIADYKLEQSYLENEIVYLKKYTRNLWDVYSLTKDSLTTKYNEAISRLYMKTPVNGTVKNIFKNRGTQAYRNDPIIQINSGEGVAVIAYFSQEDIHYLKLDTDLKIYFNDGETSYGRITEISEPVVSYDSTGEPQLGDNMKIKVKISPIEGEGDKWNIRKGYFVKIKKFRNFFN